jgi:hypothetical protein
MLRLEVRQTPVEIVHVGRQADQYLTKACGGLVPLGVRPVELGSHDLYSGCGHGLEVRVGSGRPEVRRTRLLSYFPLRGPPSDRPVLSTTLRRNSAWVCTRR